MFYALFINIKRIDFARLPTIDVEFSTGQIEYGLLTSIARVGRPAATEVQRSFGWQFFSMVKGQQLADLSHSPWGLFGDSRGYNRIKQCQMGNRAALWFQ